MGNGTSLAGNRWSAMAITWVNNCDQVYRILNAPIFEGLLVLNVALDCGSKTGGGVTTPFTFVLDGQPLVCTLINFMDGSNKFDIICGSSQSAAEICANEVLKSAPNPTSFPHATLSTPTFTFRGQ
jgi:hypothetical protein